MSLDGQRIRAREHRITSSSLLHNPKEQSLAAVSSRRGRRAKQTKRSRSVGDVKESRTGAIRGRRRGSVGGGRLRSPASERGDGRRRPQSLPRDVIRKSEDEEAGRGRRREKERGRSRQRERKSRSLERRRRMTEEEVEEEGSAAEEEPKGRASSIESEDDDVFLPIPVPMHRLPRPKENQEDGTDEDWNMAAEYRSLRRDKEEEEEEEEEECGAESGISDWPLPGVTVAGPESHREPFSFLASMLSENQLGDATSESGDSQSDASVSAASISGLSLAAAALPGPWLVPGQQRLVQFEDERHGRDRRRSSSSSSSAVS